MPARDLTPEESEKLKELTSRKLEGYLRRRLRERRAQRQREELKATLRLVRGGKTSEKTPEKA